MPRGRGSRDTERSIVRRLPAQEIAVLLIGPALFVLSSAPASAALPAQHLIELCTGEGVVWVALSDADRFPPEDPAKANGHAACAHILRPRALVRSRRTRTAG